MAKIKIDEQWICEYCNENYTTDPDGEPQCCDAAIQDWLDAGEPGGNI